MPGLDAQLISQGYTLPGQDANVITEPGGAPQIGGDISPLARVAHLIQTHIAQQKIDDQEKQKKLTEQMDTYKTLRDAGYTPERAHAAVISGEIPSQAPDGSPIKDTKAQADIANTKATTEKTIAETSILGDKKSTIESKIMNKIANGEDLLPGEQKIYDDIIKKKNNGGLAELLSQLGTGGTSSDATGGETAATSTKVTPGDPQIAVTSPDGKQGYVPQSKLAAALAKGFKKR